MGERAGKHREYSTGRLSKESESDYDISGRVEDELTEDMKEGLIEKVIVYPENKIKIVCKV